MTEMPDAPVRSARLFVGSFSYGYDPAKTVTEFDPSALWTADDLIDPLTGRPWQNTLLATGVENWEWYASIYTEIYRKTGCKLFVFWTDASLKGPVPASALASAYQDLFTRYPDLPSQPSGIFLYDEPDPDTVIPQIVAVTRELKQTFPATALYANFRYDTISTRPDSVQLIGQSSLDFVSSDEYYDVSIPQYRETYQTRLYPFLKQGQRVFVVPFAAYDEITVPINGVCPPVDPAAADTRELYSAQAHVEWLGSDSMVAGMMIYRLKNLWLPKGIAKPVVDNPICNGIGLIDRMPDGSYITPNTVAFYKTLQSAQGYGATFLND
ncbi:MAG TPA: hypothetical protein VF092_02605 [Longimicrobium sp.]